MKVSVIIPVYNDSRVSNAIDSVLSQRYDGRIELIVIDGGSTDNTLEILQKYRDRLDEMLSEPDKGVFDAINKGIRLATGEVLGFLGADDRYESPHVIADVAAILKEPGVDVCYGDLVYVNHEDLIVRYWKNGPYWPYKFHLGWAPPHPSVFVRKRVHDRYGLFDASFSIAGDYELWVRLFVRHKIAPKYIPRVLVRMGVGGVSNKSFRHVVRGNIEKVRAWQQIGIGASCTVPFINLAWKVTQVSHRSRRT